MHLPQRVEGEGGNAAIPQPTTEDSPIDFQLYTAFWGLQKSLVEPKLPATVEQWKEPLENVKKVPPYFHHLLTCFVIFLPASSMTRPVVLFKQHYPGFTGIRR